MTPTAQNRLNCIIKTFESNYGIDVVDLIEVIDRYINYYHNTEMVKRDLLCAYDDFDINSTSCGIENVLQTIKNHVDIEERTSAAVENDMFDLMMLKKFITELAVVFALNFPRHEETQEEFIKSNGFALDRSFNENLYNEN
ncbi:hypothetical protein [Soonwooa sp.]|uniref:hypothetical protein n=1 Tax=Soonwooa sp. TaxID=1938592 RepID=UPI0028B17EB7|nr:hypothetical protein [Soonwooa sp.]